ncbi:MAG: hypothetical protein IPN81_01790 [Nitrosomonadales bacterium]|nr:hypothetical protein [Nitrosomonadales bacterium]
MWRPTVALARGADLPVDIAASNYATYLYDFRMGCPVFRFRWFHYWFHIRCGRKNSVLGFAGSAWNNNGSQCQYVEGRAVINGYISVNDTTAKVVLAHEVGHLIGFGSHAIG